MGNKCCSKRQNDEFAAGYKNEQALATNFTNLKATNPLESRYTPDPNRGLIKHPGGIDIIRTGGPRCMSLPSFFIIF